MLLSEKIAPGAMHPKWLKTRELAGGLLQNRFPHKLTHLITLLKKTFTKCVCLSLCVFKHLDRENYSD